MKAVERYGPMQLALVLLQLLHFCSLLKGRMVYIGMPGLQRTAHTHHDSSPCKQREGSVTVYQCAKSTDTDLQNARNASLGCAAQGGCVG